MKDETRRVWRELARHDTPLDAAFAVVIFGGALVCVALVVLIIVEQIAQT